ncbi:cell wall-binding repeat-containing protein [Candidatus Poriferisodalis sp.]|uniref:cell wall-binding repeat-containing protein n=1 Tax=Candidatus Poriferisodalis sp. TaxID=3101277 RepID=UPI003B010CE4
MRLGLTHGTSGARRALWAALLCSAVLAASLPLRPQAASAAAAEVSVERLQGPTRYETAVAIAERYVLELAFDVGAVIVVPGTDAHAACALPAAALAAHGRAPMLLTPPDELPSEAESFLIDHRIRHVVIVGGTAAVSSAVADRLQRLTGAAPQRLGGATCSEAALAVARHLGSAGVAPGSGRTVLLATDVSPADGLAAGPFSYRGRHPLLLAHNGQLEAPVTEYLTEHIDHVIILGGPAAISEEIENQIRQRGITTQRWAGEDRFDTAARIASELLDDDSPTGCFGGDGIGLATGFGASDAIASAPLLGERCDPLLLTEPQSLPTPTATILGSDAVLGDASGLLRLTLFGGTAAIPFAIESDALRAATGRPDSGGAPATAFIEAHEGACHWRVFFSEPVLTVDAESTSNYLFDRRPAAPRLADIDAGEGTITSQANVLLAGASAYDTASVPSGCVTPVKVRDRIGIRDRAIRTAYGIGAVGSVELIVRSDTTQPRLWVLAPPGGQSVSVRSSEPLQDGDVTVTVTRARARLTRKVSVQHGDTGFTATFGFPAENSYADADSPFTEPPWLHPGDTITIAHGSLSDRAGNLNASVTHTVAADADPPQLESANVSEPTRRSATTVTVDITVRWTEPLQGCGIGPTGAAIDLGELQVDTEGDGFVDYSLDGDGSAAAGVRFVDAPDGNPWIMPGAAACDQSWWASDGSLVARLSASSPDALPGPGSRLVAGTRTAHDLVGNPNTRHTVAFAVEDPS